MLEGFFSENPSLPPYSKLLKMEKLPNFINYSYKYGENAVISYQYTFYLAIRTAKSLLTSNFSCDINHKKLILFLAT